MLSFIKKHLFLIIFLLLSGYITRCSVLNYTWYCKDEGRYLSDKEKIKRAMEYNNMHSPVPVYIEKKWSNDSAAHPNDVKYYSIDETLERNPNCCTLVKPRINSMNFLEHIAGFSYEIVVINSTERNIYDNGKQRVKDIDHNEMQIDSCGNGIYD